MESALRSVPGRRLLDLTQAEVEHFAGNCLEVRSENKEQGGGGYKRHLVSDYCFFLKVHSLSPTLFFLNQK